MCTVQFCGCGIYLNYTVMALISKTISTHTTVIKLRTMNFWFQQKKLLSSKSLSETTNRF